VSRLLDNDNQPPEDEGMEARLIKVEERLAAVERDVAVIRSNYATREDLQRELGGLQGALLKEMNNLTWRLVTFVCGFGTVLVSATYFITTHGK
jgi:hypothetical protein